MKADKIIKNAKIFTSDINHPQAAALAVKDGKFIYVGDESGLSAYEGEVTDLGGKFIMPGLIDSHVHITAGAAFEFTDLGEYVEASSKKEALDFMKEYIKSNPDIEDYRLQNRGGKGLTNYHTEQYGEVCAIEMVDETQDIIMISSDGIIIRLPAEQVRECNRPSKGVILMKTKEGEKVVTISLAEHEEAEEVETETTENVETVEGADEE